MTQGHIPYTKNEVRIFFIKILALGKAYTKTGVRKKTYTQTGVRKIFYKDWSREKLKFYKDWVQKKT